MYVEKSNDEFSDMFRSDYGYGTGLGYGFGFGDGVNGYGDGDGISKNINWFKTFKYRI